MSLLTRTIEFYDFARGAQHWRYTTENQPLIYQQQTYTYQSIKRSAISESGDLARNVLDITVPQSLPLLDLYRGTAPMEQISITLRKLRKGAETVHTIWVGEIGSVEWQHNTAVIHGLPPMAGLRGLGLKRNWQKQCPLVIYSAGLGQCNADRTSKRVDATLTTVSGATVKAAAFATKQDRWFDGGWIEWTVGTATERRFIETHVGDTITLLTPALVGVGTIVAAYPGCDQTLKTCDEKFDNAVNYGGQPWIPTKNPFGGDPIF